MKVLCRGPERITVNVARSGPPSVRSADYFFCDSAAATYHVNAGGGVQNAHTLHIVVSGFAVRLVLYRVYAEVNVRHVDRRNLAGMVTVPLGLTVSMSGTATWVL